MRDVRRPVFVKPEARYTEIGVRSHGRGVFHKEPVTGEDLGNKRVFWLKPGTLVFNIVFAWERAVAVLSEDEAGLIASHRFPMYEMVPGRADARFMKHYFTTGYGHYLLRLNSPGAAGRNKTLNQSALMKEEVWLPPADTQRAIADFLDRKTAAIDALISKKERLLELLAEQRAALIHRAVTRGLDPNVKLKDSGVECIGEVPAHWEVCPLGYCATFQGGSTPSKQEPRFWGGSVPWVSPKDMKVFEIADSTDRVTQAALTETSLRLVSAGATLIVVRGMILARTLPVAITTAPVTLNQDMKAIRPAKRIHPRFLAWQLRARVPEVMMLVDEAGHGTKALRTDLLSKMRVLVPPIGEQERLMAALDDQVGRIELVEERLGTALDRLREYRQALITAAVTGQLDLSSEAAA